MSDEFDDVFDGRQPRGRRGGPDVPGPDHPPAVPRLVSRLYRHAGEPLRARILRCLIRPLGPLGLAAIASGAFLEFLHRSGERGTEMSLDSLGRYTNDQVFELARFVQQVSPEAIQQVTSLFSDTPVGSAAFTAAATMLLARLAMGAASGRTRSSPAGADAGPPSEPGDVAGADAGR